MVSELLPASDWCLRWRQRQHRWRHRSEGGFDSRRYDVASIDEGTARTFVQAHHYSRSYPAARLRYGLVEQDRLVGVAVLSVPVQRRVLTRVFPDLAPYFESIELGRFVLLDAVPANAETWFLARAFAQAAREGVRGVVSFSDPLPRRDEQGQIVCPGHIGTIYQASSATYIGRATARTLLFLPDGTVLNDRALAKVRGQERGHAYVEEKLRAFGAPTRAPDEPVEGWLRLALQRAGVRRVHHQGCHRYAFVLGGQTARRAIRIGLASHAYPKQLDAVG